MPIPIIILIVLITLPILGCLAHWIMANPRGDLETGIYYRFSQFYAKRVHHLKVIGNEHAPNTPNPGPLIIVVNHTAGVDPILVQSAVKFTTRWIMAEDMRIDRFNWFWRFTDMIFIDRQGGNTLGLRTAINHVKNQGQLALFPEGGLERPPQHLMPFMPGVGLIIAKTRAPVLPIIIRGTPQVDPAWASLWRTSRASIEFKPIIHYKDEHAAQITQDLHQRYQAWTGWPANNKSQQPSVAPNHQLNPSTPTEPRTEVSGIPSIPNDLTSQRSAG